LVRYFLNKFAAKTYKNFPPHMNNVSTLYLVKLRMLIASVLPLSCCTKKLQMLSHLNRDLQIRQIWVHLITACAEYCKRRCTKHTSLIWTYWWCHWRMAAAMRTWSQLGPFRSQLFSSSRSVSVMRVLYIFTVFSHAAINWIHAVMICSFFL